MIASTVSLSGMSGSMSAASPKSANPALLYASIKMLAGLTSRCSTPRRCAAARASAIRTPTSRTRRWLGRGSFVIHRVSEPPGHSSMTRKGRSSPSRPASCTVTMPGWPDILPAAPASRRKRRCSASLSSLRSSTLTATSRFSDSWRASQTIAKPPRAIARQSAIPGISGGTGAATRTKIVPTAHR